MKTKPLPDFGDLIEMFDYNPDTGELRWKARPLEHFKRAQAWKTRNKRFAGKVAGNPGSAKGYLRVSVDYKGRKEKFWVHRICFVLSCGFDPENSQIDHINGIVSDNRACNLRPVNIMQNGRHRVRANTNNRSGYRGVYWCKARDKWIAAIAPAGQTRNLGSFDSLEEAAAVAEAARIEHFGEFAGLTK